MKASYHGSSPELLNGNSMYPFRYSLPQQLGAWHIQPKSTNSRKHRIAANGAEEKTRGAQHVGFLTCWSFPNGQPHAADYPVPAITSGTFGYNADDWLASDVHEANGNMINSGGQGLIYDVEDHILTEPKRNDAHSS